VYIVVPQQDIKFRDLNKGAFTVSISVCKHNQNTLCEQFYYLANSFDPEFGSASGLDTGYECTRKLNTIIWRTPTSNVMVFIF
jgi:hypothetical protein